MIRCRKPRFERLCVDRGYSIEEASACIVEQEGQWIVVDESHAAYPHASRSAECPGTELKAVLAGWPWRIKETEGCLCGPMATKMDKMGCDWCLGEGRREILDTMKAEAKKRGLPWIEALASRAIRRAVARARRKFPTAPHG